MKTHKIFFICLLVFVLVFSGQALAKTNDKTNHGKIKVQHIYGQIDFLDDIYTKEKSKSKLLSKISFTKDTISVSHSELKNKSAKIQFFLQSIKNPAVFRNGVLQKGLKPTRKGLSTWELIVPHFSNYTIQENQWLGTHDNTTTILTAGQELTLDYFSVLITNFSDNVLHDYVLDSSNSNHTFSFDDKYHSGDNKYNTSAWNNETCQIANCLRFDGEEDHIKILSDTRFDFGEYHDFSISIWVNLREIVGVDRLISTSDQTPLGGFSMDITSGKPRFFGALAGAGSYLATSGTTLTANQWEHIVLSVDRDNQARIYVNGVNTTMTLGGGNNASGLTENYNTTNYLHIGRLATTNGNNVNGTIDDVKIYGFAMNQSHVDALYANESAGDIGAFALNETGLVGHWKFDHTSGVLEDSTTNNLDGSITDATRGTVGTKNLSFTMDGVDDSIDITDSAPLDITSEITMSIWVKFLPELDCASGGTCYPRIFAKPHTADAQPYQMYGLTYIGANSDGNFEEVHFGIAGGGTQRDVQSQGDIEYHKWYHLAGTFNGTDVSLFINGVLNSTASYSGSIDTNNEPLFFAEFSPGGAFFNGSLDEARLYNRALTEEEIADLYVDGLTIINLEVNESEGTTTTEESGNDILGTLENYFRPIWKNVTGEYSDGAMEFNGGQDQHLLADSSVDLNITEEITVFVRFMPYDSASDQKIISKVNTSGGGYNGWMLGIINDNLYVELWDNTGTRFSIQNGVITENEWNTIAFTYKNGGNLVAYVNNTDVDTVPGGGTIGYNEEPLVIGAKPFSPYDDYFFNGSIDQIVILPGVVSSEELESLNNYNRTYFSYTEGLYTSEVYNFTDYEPLYEAVIWETTVSPTSLVTQVEARSGTSANITSESWQLGSKNGNTYNHNNLTESHFQFRSTIHHDDDSPPSLEYINITSYSLFKPILENISINQSTNLIGNVTFLTNDTLATGNVTFNWYKNNLLTYTTTSTGLTNGSEAISTFVGTLTKNDVFFFNATPRVIYDTIWADGDSNISENFTIANGNFNYTAFPPEQNLTLTKPNAPKFKIVLNDSDGDVNTTWKIDGVIQATGLTYTLITSDLIEGIPYSLTAEMTDGQFSKTATWTITVTDENLTLPLIIGLIGVAFLLFFFAFKLETDHFILKIGLIITGLITLILVPSAFSGGYAGVRESFLKITLWVFRLFVVYLSVYIIYHWAKGSYKFTKWLGRRKE